MNNQLPLVSVGILNYNYGRFFVEAVESVVSQAYPNIELIIVDDVSTDNSRDIIERWIHSYTGSLNINYIINEKNFGLSKSCNVILNNVNGKYFLLLDADDFFYPQKISKQVAILEKNQEAALAYSNVTVVNESGEITNPDYCKRIRFDKDSMPEGRVKDQLLEFNFITVHSALIRTASAKEVGGFDETIVLQDYYMWLQLAEKYEFRYLNECTAAYRIHSSSMSNNVKTNPASVNSAITLKFRYYKESDKAMRKKLAKNIQFASVYLYQNNYPTSKKWLTIAFNLNPGIKTFFYLFSISAGIPFSFFQTIKLVVKKFRKK